jgi:acyl-CoA synthetase (NDP forming)
MPTDAHISGMLDQLQRDPLKRHFAAQLLERYRTTCYQILGSGATADGKEVLHSRAREKLRTDLCDLLEPFMGKEHTSYLDAPPATDATQQTTPGS